MAIKDLIDLAGVPTTAGCRAVAEQAGPAAFDAACLTGIRREEAAGNLNILGKTNLHELAFGITGINSWFGTPVNPLDGSRVPGGSSSGSAVAVATGRAEMALGTDTGGSIRIPAACCGVAGLKTTFGRIPVDGVRPLAPSLDTVGPLARTVAGLVWGMQLLEEGFTVEGATPPPAIGRFRVTCLPEIDEAIDWVLSDAGFSIVPVDLPGWEQASEDTMQVIAAEAFECNGYLLASGKVGDDVAGRLEQGRLIGPIESQERVRLESARLRWTRALTAALTRVALIAMPTLSDYAPPLEQATLMYRIRQTHPVNLAGVPALALPVATAGPLPGSLQLIGLPGSEELLLATGSILEKVAAPGHSHHG